MQQKPRSFSAILPAAWTTTPLAFPAAFWKGWIEDSHPVSRLGLPAELRRSLACTNIIENMNGTIRRAFCRNVKRWNDASMALRWTGAAMREAAKGFRRLKACKHLPALRAALAAHRIKHTMNSNIEDRALAA